MKRARRQYSADWKAKIALEAIKGQRTIQQIASHYEIHPNLVTHWKKQLLEGAAEIFSNGPEAGAREDEELKAELYQQIGKLQVELDWLKKSPDSRVRGTAGMDRSGERQAELGAAVRAGRSLALGAVLSGAGGERGELEADALAGAGSDLPEAAPVAAGCGTSALSLPAAGARDRAARPGLGFRHHLCAIAARVYLSGGDSGLV